MQDRLEPPSVENLTEARRAIEAMLLVSNDPTPVQLLAQLVELPVDLVQAMCVELAGEYEEQRRGFQLAEVAGGWRFQTHPDTHAYVERFALEGIPNRLSSAALETLAIVAYKQPISRAQVGAIRGVNVDGVLRTLVQRGYVDEQGRDDGPGQATLFGTTPFFLEQLGLMALDDLPPLGDFVPSVEVLEALENTLRVDPEPEIVIVDDDGEAVTGDASSEAPSTNGHGPEHQNGSVADADADVDAAADVDADADADADVDADAAAGPDVDVEVDDAGETIGDAAADAEVPDGTDASDADEPVADDVDVDVDVAVDDEAAATDTDDVTDEPSDPVEDGQVAADSVESLDVLDSVNGSSNGSPNGSMVASNGHGDQEPVYEVLSDPAASVIPLETHLVMPTPDPVDAEADAETDADGEPVAEAEAEIDDGESESETETEIVIDDDDQVIEFDTSIALVDPEAGEAAEIDDISDEADEAPGAWIDRADPEPVVSDELEVAADPEVEMTDGTTETDAAGVDDARFPGARSPSPPDPADRLDPGQEQDREQGAGLDQGQADQDNREAATDPSSSEPNPVTNGHHPRPDNGDA